jgi:hypothetical protein
LKYKSKSKSQLLELINANIKSADEIPADLQSVKHPQNLIISHKKTKADEPAPRQYTFRCVLAEGLSSGLIESGFTPLLLNDNNGDCCKTLKQNHPDTNIICGSMDKIDYSGYVNRVDLLTGGCRVRRSASPD